MDTKKIKKYDNMLPDYLTVTISKSEDGFYAKIKELKHCQTQADSYAELLAMINDAIYTHFDIPEEYREHVDTYYPERLIEAFKKSKWEEAMKHLVTDRKKEIDIDSSRFNKVAIPV